MQLATARLVLEAIYPTVMPILKSLVKSALVCSDEERVGVIEGPSVLRYLCFAFMQDL